MRVYHKHEDPEFAYPQDMSKIMKYLESHGTLSIQATTVEKFYRDFSTDVRYASWLDPTEDTLKEFSDWLAEIDL